MWLSLKFFQLISLKFYLVQAYHRAGNRRIKAITQAPFPSFGIFSRVQEAVSAQLWHDFVLSCFSKCLIQRSDLPLSWPCASLIQVDAMRFFSKAHLAAFINTRALCDLGNLALNTMYGQKKIAALVVFRFAGGDIHLVLRFNQCRLGSPRKSVLRGEEGEDYRSKIASFFAPTTRYGVGEEEGSRNRETTWRCHGHPPLLLWCTPELAYLEYYLFNHKKKSYHPRRWNTAGT